MEGFVVGIEAQGDHLVTLEVIVALHRISLMLSQWCIGCHQHLTLVTKGDGDGIASIKMLTVGIVFQHPAISSSSECFLDLSSQLIDTLRSTLTEDGRGLVATGSESCDQKRGGSEETKLGTA